MSPGKTRDLSASVLARLLKQARRTGDDYQRLLTLFVAERFLYRLGVSSVRDRFVLKGALLLRAWSAEPHRATRDVDLLWQGRGSADAVREDVAHICQTEVDPDGIEFDPASIRLEVIRPEDEHVGTRLSLLARCGSARVSLQVDVGVDDVVLPAPRLQTIPALLGFPAPAVLAYASEHVVAEKLEAIVVLGDRNSRIKDFFDLKHLAEGSAFDRATVGEAVLRTFETRHTSVPQDDPVGLTAEYWESPLRLPQIRAFARRAGIDVGPDLGGEILRKLRPFLLPLLEDLRRGTPRPGTWPPGGPWQNR